MRSNSGTRVAGRHPSLRLWRAGWIILVVICLVIILVPAQASSDLPDDLATGESKNSAPGLVQEWGGCQGRNAFDDTGAPIIWLCGDAFDPGCAGNIPSLAEYLAVTDQLLEPVRILMVVDAQGMWDYAATWRQLRANPIELVTRSIMAEEGCKLLTEHWQDAQGVGWVIRNRYEKWYAGPGSEDYHHHPEKVPVEDYWFKAATSGVFGMHSLPLSQAAAAPMDELLYTYFGNSPDEAQVAYTIAHLIAEQAVNSPVALDPTNGALEYADAYYPNPGSSEIIWWEQTHFTDDRTSGVWWTIP